MRRHHIIKDNKKEVLNYLEDYDSLHTINDPRNICNLFNDNFTNNAHILLILSHNLHINQTQVI